MPRRNYSQVSHILQRLIGKGTRMPNRRDAPRAKRPLRVEQLEARRVFAGLVFDSVFYAAGGDSGAVYTSNVAVDSHGNTYMGGYFRGTVDFDAMKQHPGNFDSLVALGRGDGFVAKYDSTNSLVWVRQIGGSSPDSILDDSISNIEVAESGSVYISGAFSEVATFGNISKTSNGARDAFVAKLDDMGNFEWVNSWGTAGNDQANDISLGNDGRLTAAGITTGVTPTQIYLRQFDRDGNLNWSQEEFSRSDSASLHDLQTASDGSIYLLGSFKGTMNVDPTSAELLVTGSATGNNSFLTKLNEFGQFEWSASYLADANSSVSVYSIAIGTDGSVVTAGRHQGHVSLNAPANAGASLPDTVDARTFFSKLTASGSVTQLVSNDWKSAGSVRITSARDHFVVVTNGTSEFGISAQKSVGSSQGVTFTAILEFSDALDVISATAGRAEYFYNDIVADDLGNVYIPNFIDGSPTDYDPSPNTSFVVKNPATNPTAATQGAIVKLRPIGAGDSVKLLDGDFEVSLADETWVQDSQNDWFRSNQRATIGGYSAEVDGSATNATLTTANAIDLSSMASATLTFDWLIESGFDAGEYLTLDISTNGGLSWIQDVRRLNGNVSAEGVWHSETVDLTPYKSADLKVRFRSKVSAADEDANVDNVRIVGIADGPNTAPIAVIGGPTSMNEGSSVVLSGAGSSDPDGSIVSYAWDVDNDGQYNDASGVSVNFATMLSGLHTVGLQVTDNRGETAVTSVNVTVHNVAPTANAGGNLSGYVGTPVSLSAAGSSDPGNDIVNYAWDLDNDGQYDDAAGVNATFSSAAAGTYVVGVRVTDAEGASSTDSATITFSTASTSYTKFYVVDDGSPDRTYEYGATGTAIENYAIHSGNTRPRGAASNAAGDTVWVADKNRKVYVYDTSGGSLGSWSAGTLTSTAVVEGVATNGTDIWIVDSKSDKVFRYTGAASRTSGSQSAASSFSLNSSNTSPKGIVTDGTYLWIVNNSSSDKVFKYTLSGSLVGSWTIDSANKSPTGLTIDPTGASQSIWIVDSGTDKVYEYANALGMTSGGLSAANTFALADGNTNPQGIADPPSPGTRLQPTFISLAPALLSLAPRYESSLPTAVAFTDAGPSTYNTRSEERASRVDPTWKVPGATILQMHDSNISAVPTVRSERLARADKDDARDAFGEALLDVLAEANLTRYASVFGK